MIVVVALLVDGMGTRISNSSRSSFNCLLRCIYIYIYEIVYEISFALIYIYTRAKLNMGTSWRSSKTSSPCNEREMKRDGQQVVVWFWFAVILLWLA